MRKNLLLAIVGVVMIVPLLHWLTSISLGSSWEIQLYSLARIMALEAFTLILVQFILSSKIKFLENGIGLDRLLILHRRLGQIGVLLLVLHPVFLFSFAASQGFLDLEGSLEALGLVDASFSGPRSYGGAYSAFLMLSGFLLVTGTAMIYGRIRLGYETWRKVHYLTYVLLPIAFFHSMTLGSDLQVGILRYYWAGLIVVFTLVLTHRIWKRFKIRRNPFYIESITRLNHDVWNLEFSGPKIERRPGQFMILQLRRDGKLSESHPFTISSSPCSPPSVTVKSVGDFTSTIGDTEASDIAYIDAPYGIFSYLNYGASDIVFIAGGIGITPFLSMLRHIRDTGLEKRVTLIWGNKTQRDIIFRDELEAMSDQLPSFKIIHVMSHEGNWGGETGFIDDVILKRNVENLRESEFFVCGPPPMMTTVERALRNLGVAKDKIHDERFSLR